MPALRRLLAVACLALVLPAVTAGVAAASTSLVEVEPANGATLERTPADAVLTFATDLDPARSTATVTVPGQGVRDVHADVDGPRLTVGIPSAGDGDYVVGYSVVAAGEAADAQPVEGAVGFAVTPTGEAPPVGGAGPWAVAAVLAIVGLLGAVLLTVRRWQASR